MVNVTIASAMVRGPSRAHLDVWISDCRPVRSFIVCVVIHACLITEISRLTIKAIANLFSPNDISIVKSWAWLGPVARHDVIRTVMAKVAWSGQRITLLAILSWWALSPERFVIFQVGSVTRTLCHIPGGLLSKGGGPLESLFIRAETINRRSSQELLT